MVGRQVAARVWLGGLYLQLISAGPDNPKRWYPAFAWLADQILLEWFDPHNRQAGFEQKSPYFL
jgi:hypothetical protein